MKLTNLKLVNFQSHEDTEVELSGGVNAFYGVTHSGKSSIIRALRWVFKNRPSSGMLSHWADNTSVEVSTDSFTVGRHRDKNFNGYVVSGDWQSPATEYQAVGSSVPTQIQQLFSLYDFNWKEQGDGHFLIGLSSGKVAQQLNRVVALDSIDSMLNETASRIRSNRQDMQRVESDLQQAEQNLASYDYLDNLKTEIQDLEERDRVLGEWNVFCNDFRMLIEEVQKAQEVYNDYKWATEADRMVSELEQDITRLKELESYTDGLQKVTESVKQCQQKVNELAGVELFEQDIAELDRLEAQITRMKQFCNKLYSKVNELNELNEKWEKASERLQQAEQELHDNFPDVCPFCGNQVEKKDGVSWKDAPCKIVRSE